MIKVHTQIRELGKFEGEVVAWFSINVNYRNGEPDATLAKAERVAAALGLEHSGIISGTMGDNAGVSTSTWLFGSHSLNDLREMDEEDSVD